jgi:hypothetical protein
LFRSDDREIATDGKHKYVQPDGVLPLVVELFATPPATYLNSVFYEVKAVKGTLLPPGYSEYQILGFLDALSKSDAARAGEDPAIIFLTNADIREINRDTRAQGFFKGVGVWHAIACEIPTNSNDNLQFGEAGLTNPEVYFFPPRIPGPIGPGAPGHLFLYPPN